MAAKSKIVTLMSEKESTVLRAAEYVSSILKHTKTTSIEQLCARTEAKDETTIGLLGQIALTGEQLELIETNWHHVQLLRNLTTISISECPVCGGVAAAQGVVPKRCTLTLACQGNPVKSGIAKKVPVAS